jgi:Zn-dependent peptidase ImmA (M78 family)
MTQTTQHDDNTTWRDLADHLNAEQIAAALLEPADELDRLNGTTPPL